MISQNNGRKKTPKRNKTAGDKHAMKIIAIEGLDKAGKHTATNVLDEYFTSKGLTVKQMTFPNYSSPIGVLIYKWLHGRLDADQETFELLQAADKQHAQAEIEAHEKSGVDVLLIDRYIHSQWAYGAYHSDDVWLKDLTKYLREPDVVLYLDVEPEVSMHRRGKYGDNDKYESDVERLRYTKREYFCLFDEMNEETEVWTIDANQPQIITKAAVLETACQLYEAFTGKVAKKKDYIAALTEEELRVVQHWSEVIKRDVGEKVASE